MDAPGRVPFHQQPPVLEDLVHEDRAGCLEVYHVHPPAHGVLQSYGHVEAPLQAFDRIEAGREKHGHVRVAPRPGLAARPRPEEVGCRHVGPALQEPGDFLLFPLLRRGAVPAGARCQRGHRSALYLRAPLPPQRSRESR